MNTNTNNSNNQIFIGIDVSKDELEVFNDQTELFSTSPNKKRDLTKLAKQLKKINPTLIVLEATGGYEAVAANVFNDLDIPFAIVYPLRVRQFANGLGIMAKTDKIDAKTIAYYGRIAKIKAKPLESPEVRHLQALTRRRLQLIEIRLAEENRLETAPRSIHQSIKKHIKYLIKQIDQLKSEITKQIKSSENWNKIDQRLQAVPGVGPVLSSTLITQLPELGNISNKQIASLVGVAPFPSESGKHKGKRYCKGGRNSIRRILYMATISATRYNPIIKEFYEHLLEKGKLKKVAIIACARKLLCILNAMIRNKTDWLSKIEPISA